MVKCLEKFNLYELKENIPINKKMSPSLAGKAVINENSNAFKLNKSTIVTLYTLNFHCFISLAMPNRRMGQLSSYLFK